MLQSVQGGSNLPSKNPLVGKYPPMKKEDSGSASSMHYSSDSVSISYKNSDGEEFSLEMERIEFKSTNLSRYSDDEKEHWRDVVKQIKEEFKKFKSEGLKGLISGEDSIRKGEKIDFSKLSIEELNKKTDELEELMPEAWRPDAVSERIVQFVTSFYGKAESEGEEFYKIALAAINNGFGMANHELGKLPGDIENVITRTREMVQQKLDRWAKEMGIDVDKESDGALPPASVDTTKGGIDITG